MKGQDIVILLKLVSLNEQKKRSLDKFFRGEDPYSVRSLESSLGISKTEVSASIKRCLNSKLAIRDWDSSKIIPNQKALYNFIIHGLKFVFPANPGSMTRGIPTTFSAPVLNNALLSAGEDIYVWPFAEGKEKGQSLAPLFKTVPEAVMKDEQLYRYLALVDAIRIGNPREAGLAEELLAESLLK